MMQKIITKIALSLLIVMSVFVPTRASAIYVNEKVSYTISISLKKPGYGFCYPTLNKSKIGVPGIQFGNPMTKDFVTSFGLPVELSISEEGHYELSAVCDASDENDESIDESMLAEVIGITVESKPSSTIEPVSKSRDEVIPFKEVQIRTDELEEGKSEVVQEGKNGLKRFHWTQDEDSDGNVIEGTISTEREEVISEPVDQIVHIGTKVPESGSQEDGGSTHIPKDPEPQPERDTTPKVEQPDNDVSEEMPVVKEEPEPEPLNEKDFITEVYVASAHNNMRLDLSPDFTPMGRTYTVDVPKEVKKVRIDIVAHDDERLQVKYDKEVEVKEGGQDIMVDIIYNGISQRPLKITLKPENSVLFEKRVDGLLYYSVKGNTLEDLKLLVGKEFVYNKMGQLLIGKHSLGLVQAKLDDNALLEWRLNNHDGEPKTAVQPLLLMSEKNIESDDNKELILLLIDKKELANNQNPKGLKLEELSAKLKTFLVLDKKIQEKPIYGYQLSESEVIVPSVLDYEKATPYWIVVNTELGTYKRYEIEPTETTVQDKEERVDIFSLVLLIASLAVIGIMALFALHPKFRTARGLDASNKKESAKDARNANSKVTEPINQNSQDVAKTKVVEIVNIPKNRNK